MTQIAKVVFGQGKVLVKRAYEGYIPYHLLTEVEQKEVHRYIRTYLERIGYGKIFL